MCGIAGIVSLGENSIPPLSVKKMCDRIAHRGPDDAGYTFFQPGPRNTGENGYWCGFVDPEFDGRNEHLPVFGGNYCNDESAKHKYKLGLGHRRLSIIDLTHLGHQPMSSSDRRFWITYNGEIYNFPELKKELVSKGYCFRTGTDTEVILTLFQAYGTDALEKLNGMFAFAIYDRIKNELVIARDRFGVKPLYYAEINGRFLFCSEIKGILASGLVKAEINPAAMMEYFTFQNILGDDMIFQNVKLLPAGAFMKLKPGSNSKIQIVKYHTLGKETDLSLAESPAKTTNRIADFFQKAVRRQLISDVEVGSYLSGGMDSGSIVAVAGQQLPRLLTFTGGFDLTNVNGIEEAFDERTLAERLSYLLQTEHYDVVLHAGDMPAAMEKVTWHLDDPRVGMSHPNWYVAKLSSKFVKVCLSGAGGDELFGGYPWRYRIGFGATSFKEFDDAYFKYWHRLLDKQNLSIMFPDYDKYSEKIHHNYQNVYKDAPALNKKLSLEENLINRALHFEFKTFLHGVLLVEDHISMAHSLETRVPFLDNDLVDFAFAIPPSMKLHTQSLKSKDKVKHIETSAGKLILRKAMEKYLPAEFTKQKKQGFSSPDENWYRGPSMNYIKDILLSSKALSRPWMNKKFVKQKLDEHFSGRHNHRLLIWSMLSFEWLQRHYLDNKGNTAEC